MKHTEVSIIGLHFKDAAGRECLVKRACALSSSSEITLWGITIHNRILKNQDGQEFHTSVVGTDEYIGIYNKNSGVFGHTGTKVNPEKFPVEQWLSEISKEKFDEAFHKALSIIRENHRE